MSTATAPPTSNGDAAAERAEGRAADQLAKYALVGVLVALIALFSILRPESFGTLDNGKAILNNQITILMLALAATLPLIVGEFDLSIAAIFGFVQVLVVGLVLQSGWSVPLAILAVMAAAALVGLINGIAIARFQINSFIATLASGSILTGITLAYSKGESIFGQAPAALTDISRAELLGMKLPVWYGLVVVLALALVLGRLPIGRRMYATGSNQRAASLTGIPTTRYVVATFVVGALLAGFGGVILGASLGAATPDTGNALLIPAFAGAFLGVTAFTPGRFNVLGTFVAVYVVGVAVTGLQQLGAALWVEPVFNGAVLFVAVGLSAYTSRLRSRRARRARLRELEERRAASSGPGGGPVAPLASA